MNPHDPSTGEAPIDIHTPFTPAERIQQLSQIDTDISALLQHTSSALRSIANPPNSNSQTSPPFSTPGSDEAAAAALASFKEIQSNFINTLDRIDKHLKRNIYALEEAGIITLKAADEAAGGEGAGNVGESRETIASGPAGTGRAKEVVARLDPNGVGRYGRLDVGRLNMTSSTVEKDIERELWERALGQVLEEKREAEGRGDRMEE
ncbi:mediator complex, subunit Med11 [Podospora aff. communis PSN243]|uniref:Mediator of RNA polymerase II transcription subunit 11 n=1 Tax=Podospora aff. communis PSN243 TaxID=3040156 RepID=A0AAV9H0T1_9PEZI|nr:mediator complex, subunit Med11 [Podospora aff. communis PSN243]